MFHDYLKEKRNKKRRYHPRAVSPFTDSKNSLNCVLHRCAGGSTLHFNLNLLGQASIVFFEMNKNFLTTKVINDLFSGRKGLTQFGTGKDYT